MTTQAGGDNPGTFIRRCRKATVYSTKRGGGLEPSKHWDVGEVVLVFLKGKRALGSRSPNPPRPARTGLPEEGPAHRGPEAMADPKQVEK